MTVLAFQKPTDPDDVARVRLEDGMFFADIVLDSKSDPAVYIVVLQEHDSHLVRGITRHASMKAAELSARNHLNQLSARAA